MTIPAVLNGLILVTLSTLLIGCAPGDSGDNLPDNPVSLNNSPEVEEGDSGASILIFELVSPIAREITYSTFNISAASGSDYVSTSGTLVFTANERHSVEVTVLGDTRVEASETIGLRLSYNDDTQSQFEGTIINDDFPELSVSDVSIEEGNQGSRTLEFVVQLDQKTVDPFPLRILIPESASIPGNARAGEDFNAIDQQMTIPAGGDELRVPVQIFGDTDIEPDEDFSLEVYNLSNQLLGSATGTINNDDIPGNDFPEVSVQSASGNEGTGSDGVVDFNVTLDFAVEVELFYQVITGSDDTATLGDDLPEQSGSVVFDGTETGKTISINTHADDIFETDETFTLLVTSEQGFLFDSAQGTILNDDAPNVQVSNVVQNEGNNVGGVADSTPFEFTVTLLSDLPAGESLTFEYRTSNGTASYQQGDYRRIPGQDDLTLSSAAPSDTISVTVNGDNDFERDETFELNVFYDNEEIATGTATIVNDDDPVVTITPSPSGTPDEGDEGETGEIEFAVTTEEELSGSNFVYYRTQDGSAVGGDDLNDPDIDFEHTQGQLDIADESSEFPVVRYRGNDRVEQDRTFAFEVYSDSQRTKLLDSYEVTLRDDDTITLTLTPASISIGEGNPDNGETSISRSLVSLLGEDNLPDIQASGAITEQDYDLVFVRGAGSTADGDDISLGAGGDTLTLTLPAGNYTVTPYTAAIEDIEVHGDRIVENDETLELTLDSNLFVSGEFTEGARTMITIVLQNDDALELQFDDTTARSDDEDSPSQTPQVRAVNAVAAGYQDDGPGGAPLTFELQLGASSTATADDFDEMNVTVDVMALAGADGVSAGELFDVISVVADNIVEEDELARLQLVNPGSGVALDPDADEVDYTLLNDDVLTVGFSKSSYQFTAGTAPDAGDALGLTVTGAELDANSPNISVDFTNTEVTAVLGTHYESDNQTIQLPKFDFEQPGNQFIAFDDDDSNLQFRVISNNRVHFGKTLALALTDNSEYVTLDGSADDVNITILTDNQLTVRFADSSYTFTEGDAVDEADRVGFTVTGGELDLDAGDTLSFSIDFIDGTAEQGAGQDYTSDNQLIELANNTGYDNTFVPLDAVQLVIVDDEVVEADKAFTIALLSVNAPNDQLLVTEAPDTTEVTIEDDDTLNVAFSNTTFQIIEDNVLTDDLPVLVVTGETEIDVSVPVEPGDTAGLDYAFDSGDLNIEPITLSPGEYNNQTVTVDLTIAGDNTPEFNEALPLTIVLNSTEPLAVGNPFETQLRVLNDDLELWVNGSGAGHCATDDELIECDEEAITGSAYNTQDAQQNTLGDLSFTDPSTADSGWECKTDDRTMLLWAVETTATAYSSLNDAETELAAAIANERCGTADWRLPTLAELFNLMDFSALSPLVNTTLLNTLVVAADDAYWSGTANGGSDNWLLKFESGALIPGANGDDTERLMLVSTSTDPASRQLQETNATDSYLCAQPGTELPAAAITNHRYTVSGTTAEPVVTDNLTGLTWAVLGQSTDDSAPGESGATWESVLEAARDSTYADLIGWRVPTVKELLSILTFNCETDDDGTLLDNHQLNTYFLPLIDGDTGLPLPLISSTPVIVDPTELWILAPGTPETLIQRSDPPSQAIEQQTFMVRTDSPF
ncbi:Calx-beta domain-containing protein [Saccharospirillum alexandrii]|uniref:Calx-beta domain-containing protein n=1 Tax=Saccharospirillum alexandrii TaxID=2448477 RepID=UPI000FD752B1|nr:Calx-beta domain-containing protein [Saccharospirillum alexandrii]